MKKFDINQFKPCEAALEWYNQQPSTEAAWANCHRADWMLYIAVKLYVGKRLLTLTTAYCAKTVYHLMSESARDSVVTAINYGRGKINCNKKELMIARAQFDTNCINSYSDYHSYNARKAAYYINWFILADINNYIVDISNAIICINKAIDTDRIKHQQKMADICRKYLTDAVFNKIK